MPEKKTQALGQTAPAAPNDTRALPIALDVRINSIQPNGKVRATASVNMNGCFAIRSVKVMEGAKGFFVSLPGYKLPNGKYKEYCFPVTSEFRAQLNSSIIEAYQSAIIQSHKTAMHGVIQPDKTDESCMRQSI